ncbi:MAG: hypothetical protein ACRCXX_09755 [Cetobacterium sp.]|uniref:hypothetical protein n=1 Tax=Cetobacterium sp. TaxID=2071632 RepID=UPI003F3AC534
MILKNVSVPLGTKVQILIDNGCIVDIFINGEKICENREMRFNTTENGVPMYCLDLKEIESIEFSGIDLQQVDLREILNTLKLNREKKSCNTTAQEDGFDWFPWFSLGISIISFIVSLFLFFKIGF